MSTENINTSSDFQFDESQFKIRSRRIIGEPEIPTMIRVLVKNKFVKTENQAVAVLLTVVALFIIATVFIINSSVAVAPAIPDSESLSLK